LSAERGQRGWVRLGRERKNACSAKQRQHRPARGAKRPQGRLTRFFDAGETRQTSGHSQVRRVAAERRQWDERPADFDPSRSSNANRGFTTVLSFKSLGKFSLDLFDADDAQHRSSEEKKTMRITKRTAPLKEKRKQREHDVTVQRERGHGRRPLCDWLGSRPPMDTQSQYQ